MYRQHVQWYWGAANANYLQGGRTRLPKFDFSAKFPIGLHLILQIIYHISYHIKLYSNIIHQNKSIKHNMMLRTWSKGQKGLRQACPNRALTKVSTNTNKKIQNCLLSYVQNYINRKSVGIQPKTHLEVILAWVFSNCFLHATTALAW